MDQLKLSQTKYKNLPNTIKYLGTNNEKSSNLDNKGVMDQFHIKLN